MSQISSTDISQLLQLASRSTGTSAGGASRIPLGQIVQAEVLQTLPDGLFKLSIGSNTVTASSQIPLATGDLLNLETSLDATGTVNLRLLNQTTLPQNNPAAGATEPAVTYANQQNENEQISSAANGTTSAAVARLATLVLPGGPISQFVSQRPDLAPRIESLLRSVLDRPSSLGTSLQTLQQQLSQFASVSSQNPETAKIANQSTKLLDQLFGKNALENPRQLADTLATRVTSLARGFEGSIAFASEKTMGSSATQLPPSQSHPPRSSLRPFQWNIQLLPRPPAPVGRLIVAEEALKLLGDQQNAPEILLAGKSSAEVNSQTPAAGLEEIPQSTDAPPVLPLESPSTANANQQHAAIVLTSAASNPGQLRETVPASMPTNPSTAGTVAFQGAFASDLKGQLLELRTQLGSLAASQPHPRSDSAGDSTDRDARKPSDGPTDSEHRRLESVCPCSIADRS